MSAPTSPVVVRSFAKINLALAVLGKRPDGYHEIRTVFQSIDLHDRIELRPGTGLELECDGLPDVAPNDNLVWKAACALQRRTGASAGAHITLAKTIPAGAGLGGGSSNAAAALLGLRRLWRLDITDRVLAEVASGLGSDVPFFLHGGTALGRGRGDEISELPEPPQASLVVIYPGEQVATAEAYRSLSLGLTSRNEDHRIHRFCGRLQVDTGWTAELFNDFETSILPARPAIRQARNALIDRGATAALMSGSGSSVFGFFLDEESALAASRAVAREGWRVFPAKTLSRSEFQQRTFG